MKADPIYADIYLRFREKDFGKTRLPGFEIETLDTIAIFSTFEAAMKHLRQMHDDNLKGTE